MNNKKLLPSILILLLLTGFKPADFKTSDIFHLKFISENGDQINRTSVVIKESALDSLDLIRDREVAITYLRSEYVNSDSLNQFLPDTNAVKKQYNQLIANPELTQSIHALLFPNKLQPKEYSKSKVMDVASRFFYVFNSSQGYRLLVCTGLNGITNTNNAEDHILEALVLESIMTKIINGNGEQPEFIKSAYSYITEALKDSTIEESEVRKQLYASMKTNEVLEKTVLDYFNREKDNLPVKLKSE